jgi:hypothetical protein
MVIPLNDLCWKKEKKFKIPNLRGRRADQVRDPTVTSIYVDIILPPLEISKEHFFNFVLKSIAGLSLFDYIVGIVPNGCPQIRETIFAIIVILIRDM